METLAEELKKREAIVLNKEALLAEKSELEIKKLRSSQVLSKVRRGKMFWLFPKGAALLQFSIVFWKQIKLIIVGMRWAKSLTWWWYTFFLCLNRFRTYFGCLPNLERSRNRSDRKGKTSMVRCCLTFGLAVKMSASSPGKPFIFVVYQSNSGDCTKLGYCRLQLINKHLSDNLIVASILFFTFIRWAKHLPSFYCVWELMLYSLQRYSNT